jgi:hypothetical protein
MFRIETTTSKSLVILRGRLIDATLLKLYIAQADLIVFVVEAELAVLGLVSKGPRGPLCFEVLIIKGLRALLLFLRAPNLECAPANIGYLVNLLVLQDSHGPAKLSLLDWADP